ncbi:TPA: putative HNHc nuclease [Streptococcus suis]
MLKVEIIKVDESKGEILLKVHSKLDMKIFEDNKYKNRLFAYLEPWLKGSTTDEQRKHWWAILGDISNYTGLDVTEIAMNFKRMVYKVYEMKKEPTMRRNGMKKEDGNRLIQFALDYAIERDIPLNHDYSNALTNRQYYAMLMKRICWVCNKPNSEIAHYEAVGMGRNRDKIDHTQHRFMCLCIKHHKEQHDMGANNFCQHYHLEPIKLSRDNLKELGVM